MSPSAKTGAALSNTNARSKPALFITQTSVVRTFWGEICPALTAAANATAGLLILGFNRKPKPVSQGFSSTL
jgi:hypothetical protein